MKVSQLLENDEWSNVNATIEQLDRIQKARTNEFFLYYMPLVNKYDVNSKQKTMWNDLQTMQKHRSIFFTGFDKDDRVTTPLKELFKVCTPEEKAKCKMRFERMFNAKQELERAREQGREIQK
jgi:hypothetical protein